MIVSGLQLVKLPPLQEEASSTSSPLIPTTGSQTAIGIDCLQRSNDINNALYLYAPSLTLEDTSVITQMQ